MEAVESSSLLVCRRWARHLLGPADAAQRWLWGSASTRASGRRGGDSPCPRKTGEGHRRCQSRGRGDSWAPVAPTLPLRGPHELLQLNAHIDVVQLLPRERGWHLSMYQVGKIQSARCEQYRLPNSHVPSLDLIRNSIPHPHFNFLGPYKIS